MDVAAGSAGNIGRAPRETPYPAGWTVRQGLDAYLGENGFTVEAYDAPTTEAVFLRVTFHVPNTPAHRRAIMRHDLHHVVTGYGTDPAGEGEISAWEIRRGLRGLDLYVRSIVVGGLMLGLTVAPRRTLRALRASGRGNLFDVDDHTYEALMDRTIGELRAELGIPEEGLADHPRGLHSGAPHRP
ncbi:MAG: hypothetical protein ACOC5B_02595 [Myxococcota bacterium]